MADANDPGVPKAGGPLEGFLHPQSMVTPGVAGAITMMIANVLALNFGMPRAWIGIVVSFLFGLLIFATQVGIVQRVVYYVLNSLIIFCVALGANSVGVGVTSNSGVVISSLQVFSIANAEESLSPAQSNPYLTVHIEDLSKRLIAVSAQIDTSSEKLADLAQGASQAEISALEKTIATLEGQKLSIIEELATTVQAIVPVDQPAGSAAPAEPPLSQRFFSPWKF